MSALLMAASSSTVSSSTSNPLLNKMAARIVGSKYGHVTSICRPFRMLLSGVKKNNVRTCIISGPGPIFPVIRPGFFKFSTKLSPGFAVPPSVGIPSRENSSRCGFLSGSSTATSMASGFSGGFSSTKKRKHLILIFVSGYTVLL